MEIPKKLQDEIWDYCRLNNISNIDDFIINMVRDGFNIEKYGNSPFDNETIVPKIIEKEVVKEIIKEVPVEKIVEKRVEIPVEVIKEVENIVFKTDDEVVNKLQKELDLLRQELDKKLDIVVDEKYKVFWEEEIESHDKTKEEVNKLKEIINHLKGGSEDNKDIYDDNNRGWWGGGSNIRRKK